MRCWTLALAVLLLVGCRTPPDRPQEVPPPTICSGQVEFDLEGHFGRLLCDDFCDDGTPCRELFSDTGDHSWCGCPDEPEPSLCHVVAVKKTDDEWEPDCTGKCPLDEPCREERRWEDSDGGVISCECLEKDD